MTTNPPQGTSPESDGSSVPGLLTRLKIPTESDWQRLLTLYGPMVLFWCRLRGLQTGRTTDLFAAVFQAVAAGVSEFDGQLAQGSFRNWVRTITQNVLDDALIDGTVASPVAATSSSDGKTPANALPEMAGQQSPSAAEDMLLMRQALELIRSEFDAATFDAFSKLVLERQPVTTVADNLGMKPHGVRVARSRVLHRLREEFGTLLD